MRNSKSAKVKTIMNLVSQMDDARQEAMIYIATGLNLSHSIEKGALNDGSTAKERVEVTG